MIDKKKIAAIFDPPMFAGGTAGTAGTGQVSPVNSESCVVQTLPQIPAIVIGTGGTQEAVPGLSQQLCHDVGTVQVLDREKTPDPVPPVPAVPLPTDKGLSVHANISDSTGFSGKNSSH
jgi:hypothetical protein